VLNLCWSRVDPMLIRDYVARMTEVLHTLRRVVLMRESSTVSQKEGRSLKRKFGSDPTRGTQ
jgi:hypothetical protein